MRHKNSVKQLNRSYSHRKAMMGNMVTSLFQHERIVTTKQKGKELKKISEKMITRAKKNLAIGDNENEKKLHNKREIMKLIKNRTIVKKLFENIAPRFKDRKGGYTRIYLLGRRPGDAAEMAIVELVERVAPVGKQDKIKDADKKPEKKKGFGLSKFRDKKDKKDKKEK